MTQKATKEQGSQVTPWITPLDRTRKCQCWDADHAGLGRCVLIMGIQGGAMRKVMGWRKSQEQTIRAQSIEGDECMAFQNKVMSKSQELARTLTAGRENTIWKLSPQMVYPAKGSNHLLFTNRYKWNSQTLCTERAWLIVAPETGAHLLWRATKNKGS